MRIEKINGSQVRCVITEKDLSERNITTSELKNGSNATRAFLREVLGKAKEEYGFNREELPIMIEAVPMSKEELVLIISAVEEAEAEDPAMAFYDDSLSIENCFEEGNVFAEPEIDQALFRTAVFRFGAMKDAIRFSKEIVEFPGYTELYRGREEHEFLMVLYRPEEMSTRDFCMLLNRVSEFGELVPESPTLSAALKEHAVPVLIMAHLELAMM